MEVPMRIAIAFMAAAGALVLAGCGGSKSSSSTEPSTTGSTPPTASPATTTAVPKATVIPIRIKDGKPVGGITRADVKKGQLVDLVVHSDVADEVHLHGYDLHQDVEPGGTARIRFQAKIPGVFEAELEKRKLQILELTVR
jgi:hypothetical protein